jgi:hypothetical protein
MHSGTTFVQPKQLPVKFKNDSFTLKLKAMKTINYLRQYTPIVIISTLLIASTFGASAENHEKEGKGNNRGHERKESRLSDRNNERTATNDWQNRRNGDGDDRNYEASNHRNEYHPEYTRRNDHEHLNYYNHPSYGRVYNRFENNPIVFRNQYGDYFYSGNNFYRYRYGIGYCISEPPRNQYYRNLPVECNRVYVNGRAFFRSGDLFFKLSPRGYELVSSPFEIRFTARF